MLSQSIVNKVNRTTGQYWTISFTSLKKIRLFLWFLSGLVSLNLSGKRIIWQWGELGINAFKRIHLRHSLFMYLTMLQYYKTLSTPSYTFPMCLTQRTQLVLQIQQCCCLWKVTGWGGVLGFFVWVLGCFFLIKPKDSAEKLNSLWWITYIDSCWISCGYWKRASIEWENFRISLHRTQAWEVLNWRTCIFLKC